MIVVHRSALRAARVGLIIGIGFGVCAPTHADAMAVIVKGGSFRVSHDRQTIDGGTIQIDDGASGVFGLEGEWRQASGLAIGVEYLQYENDVGVSSAARTGTMETSVLLLNIKKYFHPTSPVNPYIGAGFGAAAIEFSGFPISGVGGGVAFHAVGGIEARWDRVGFYTELKALSAETVDTFGGNAKASGSGAFAGVSISF